MTTTQKPPFGLRMPDALKAKITKAAKITGRSLNAEIVHRLGGSFTEASTDKRLKALEAALKKQGLMK